jgi:hypothetical protein
MGVPNNPGAKNPVLAESLIRGELVCRTGAGRIRATAEIGDRTVLFVAMSRAIDVKHIHVFTRVIEVARFFG